VITLTTERLALSPETRLLLAVGFLGSYTTFSSYAVESLGLLRDSGLWTGILNMIGNNMLALISALLGVYLARLVGD
jgi:CrcB protein